MVKIQALELLVRSGKASVMNFHEVMDKISIARLSDPELMRLTDALLGFPGVIETVTKYPEAVRGNLELASYYYAVKGSLKPKRTDGHVGKLVKLRQQISRYVNADRHRRPARKRHDYAKPQTYTLAEVKSHFEGLQVGDAGRFKDVLEGVRLALHCPEIVPQNAVLAFGPRWYSVKQFVVTPEYKGRTDGAPKIDKRKNMFIQGAENLKQYLSPIR